MKTKIVFVLTSSTKDIYLEQLWVSVFSLRLKMPKGEAWIVLLTDKITETTFTGHREKFLEYFDEIISVDLDSSLSGLQRSRWLKTKSRELVNGDMIYIDSDTVFIDRLDELDNLTYDLGAVKDCHVDRVNSFQSWDKTRTKDFVKKCELLGFDVKKEMVTFNGGMVYVKDSEIGRSFFSIWHDEWKKSVKLGFNTDQPSFTKTNMMLGHPIVNMPGVFNCQVAYGLQYLYNAKILHYYATSTQGSSKELPYWFMNDSVYEEVRECGDITDKIKDALEHPLALFRGETKIVCDKAVYIASSRSFFYLQYLCMHHRHLYEFVERCLWSLSKLRKK